MNENSSVVHGEFIRIGDNSGVSIPLSRLALLLVAIVGSVAASGKELVIDSAQSRIEIVVRATVDSFTGRLDEFRPTVTVDDAGRVTGARLSFRFRDVHTGKAKRDRAMHEWQRTDEFADGEFVLGSLTPPASGPARASGRLTLHGVTRDIEFPVDIVRQGRAYAIDGDAPLDVREFGLPVIRMLGVLKVDPVVHVKFHLQGRAP